MKDSEFIELLNLYLDHEIGADDAAQLEAEVQNNPVRRRLYRDYCQMQKACKVLAQDFGSAEVSESDRNVIPFPTGPAFSRRASWYVTGTLAAAACVAVAFVSHRRQADGSVAPVAVQVAPAPAVPVVDHSSALAATHRGVERGNAGDLSLRHTDATLAIATAAQNDPHFAWMQDVRLTPLQNPSQAQLNLEAPPSPKIENRGYVTGNRTLPSDLQWTAVRFQR